MIPGRENRSDGRLWCPYLLGWSGRGKVLDGGVRGTYTGLIRRWGVWRSRRAVMTERELMRVVRRLLVPGLLMGVGVLLAACSGSGLPESPTATSQPTVGVRATPTVPEIAQATNTVQPTAGV